MLSVEIALYSMITYISASKTLDFIIEGIEEYIGVTIVSPYCEAIQQMIVETMGRELQFIVGNVDLVSGVNPTKWILYILF